MQTGKDLTPQPPKAMSEKYRTLDPSKNEPILAGDQGLTNEGQWGDIAIRGEWKYDYMLAAAIGPIRRPVKEKEEL